MADDTDARDEMMSKNINEIKELIINVIRIIRGKRQRPTTEGIFHFIKKDKDDIDISQFKHVFDTLVENGVLIIKGEGRTSPYLLPIQRSLRPWHVKNIHLTSVLLRRLV